jgi:hypothetical protein
LFPVTTAARARVVRGLFSSLALFDAAESFQFRKDSTAGMATLFLKDCCGFVYPMEAL